MMVLRSPRLCSRHRSAGVALVLVLIVLAMLVASVVLFLGTAGRERQASRLITESHRARELARLAGDRVAATIATATTDLVKGEEWVSQPGMIRVFGRDSQLKRAIKLYSAEKEEITSQETLLSEVAADVPADWASQPRLYTDLNAPNPMGRYPILAPDAATQVAGFSAPSGVAMPVRWWYLQRDGTLQPEPGNAPIGRIAWWTDDETAKLNVNTASEGGFYDYPRNSLEDGSAFLWHKKVPARFEFNLHQGHPATTSLSPVFPGLTAKQLIDASPHVRWGGTEGGSRISVTLSGANVVYDSGFVAPPLSQARLYPTLDEYYYSAASGDRVTHLSAREVVDRARFFATTHSAGSNLNPFGQPRVTLWPVPEDSNSRSPYDQKIVKASTYAGKEYLFTRKAPMSATEDIDIPRNRALFNWLIDQTKLVPPGVGDTARLAGTESSSAPAYSLAAKYGAVEWKQVMAGIFSYIRLTNLLDASPVSPSVPYTPARLPEKYVAAPENGLTPELAGAIVPIKIDNDTYGFGRHPLLSEVALHLFVIEQTGDTAKLGLNLYFDTEASVSGMPIAHPFMTLEVATGLFRFENNSIVASITNSFTSNKKINYNNFSYDGTFGISYMLANVSSTLDDLASTTPLAAAYPFKTEIPNVPVPAAADGVNPTLAFNGGTVILKIKIGTAEIQQYTISFPAATFPFPKFEGALATGSSAMVPSTFAQRLIDPNGKVSGINRAELVPQLFKRGDVVRSMELRDGDSRILAMANKIGSGQFVKHNAYDNTAVMHAHRLTFRGGRQFIEEKDRKNAEVTRFTSDTDFLQTPLPNNYTVVFGSEVVNPPSVVRNDLFKPSGNAVIDGPSSFQGGFEALSTKWSRDFNYSGGSSRISRSDDSNGDVTQSQTRLHYSRLLEACFTPLRQVTSAVQFGVIPTGVKRSLAATTRDDSRPWQTLLFSPNPAGPLTGVHVGLEKPKDHYLLDFFHHPVVEPYAMTVPGSSYGQVNLNQQIIPFTSISRTTALHGLFKGTRLNSVSNLDYNNHKGSSAVTMRKEIDAERTAAGWAQRFSNGEVYRSPSEIASLYLVPKIPSPSTQRPQPEYAGMEEWWKKQIITGDDLKEQPYNFLYPRVTTRSNTYRVHVIAQALSPAFVRYPDAPNGGAAHVTGEWRGSMVLERALMPEKRLLAVGAGNTAAAINPDVDSLAPYHTFTIVETEKAP